MKTLRRRVADLIEAVSGNLVIPPDEAWRVHEWIHLRRFFRHFAVDCIFDVGANRGQYAQMIRNQVGFKGDIISFEPIPELARELREIAASDPHWYIEERALDREAGPSSFQVMADSQFSSLLMPRADQPAISAISTRSLILCRSNDRHWLRNLTAIKRHWGSRVPI